MKIKRITVYFESGEQQDFDAEEGGALNYSENLLNGNLEIIDAPAGRAVFKKYAGYYIEYE